MVAPVDISTQYHTQENPFQSLGEEESRDEVENTDTQDEKYTKSYQDAQHRDSSSGRNEYDDTQDFVAEYQTNWAEDGYTQNVNEQGEHDNDDLDYTPKYTENTDDEVQNTPSDSDGDSRDENDEDIDIMEED